MAEWKANMLTEKQKLLEISWNERSTLAERTEALKSIDASAFGSTDYRFTPWNQLPESIRQELSK